MKPKMNLLQAISHFYLQFFLEKLKFFHFSVTKVDMFILMAKTHGASFLAMLHATRFFGGVT